MGGKILANFHTLCSLFFFTIAVSAQNDNLLKNLYSSWREPGRPAVAIARGRKRGFYPERNKRRWYKLDGWSLGPTAPYPSSPAAACFPSWALSGLFQLFMFWSNVLVEAACLLSWASSAHFRLLMFRVPVYSETRERGRPPMAIELRMSITKFFL